MYSSLFVLVYNLRIDLRSANLRMAQQFANGLDWHAQTEIQGCRRMSGTMEGNLLFDSGISTPALQFLVRIVILG